MPPTTLEWESYVTLSRRAETGALFAHVGRPSLQEYFMTVQTILRNLSFHPENQAFFLSRGLEFSRVLLELCHLDMPQDPELALESRKNALVILSNLADRFVVPSDDEMSPENHNNRKTTSSTSNLDMLITMLIDFIDVESAEPALDIALLGHQPFVGDKKNTLAPGQQGLLQPHPYRLLALDTLARLSLSPGTKPLFQQCISRGGLDQAVSVLLRRLPQGQMLFPDIKLTDMPLLLSWELALLTVNVWIDEFSMHDAFIRALPGGNAGNSGFLHRLLSIAASEVHGPRSEGSDGRGKGLGGIGTYFISICARSMRIFLACVRGHCTVAGEEDEVKTARVLAQWEGNLERILQRFGLVEDSCSGIAADCLYTISRFS